MSLLDEIMPQALEDARMMRRSRRLPQHGIVKKRRRDIAVFAGVNLYPYGLRHGRREHANFIENSLNKRI